MQIRHKCLRVLEESLLGCLLRFIPNLNCLHCNDFAKPLVVFLFSPFEGISSASVMEVKESDQEQPVEAGVWARLSVKWKELSLAMCV